MPDTNHEPRMGGREWGLLLLLSMLWGGSFFFFKVLVDEFPPFTVVLGRVGLAALALNAYLLGLRVPLPTSIRPWGAFLAMGLLNNVIPFTLIVFGETRVSSGLASILNATTPIFGALAAHLLTTDEKLSWSKGLGVAFGFFGVAVLIGPGALASGGDLLGEVSCLLAAMVYAFAGIYGRRFRGLSPLVVATGQITASTAVVLPLAAFVDRPWTLAAPSAQAWGAWIAIALFSTAVAYMIYFRILAVAGATNLLLVTFLLPVSAMWLGAAFLGEAVTPRAIGGMSLIGLGLVAIDGRVWRLARRARPIGERRT